MNLSRNSAKPNFQSKYSDLSSVLKMTTCTVSVFLWKWCFTSMMMMSLWHQGYWCSLEGNTYIHNTKVTNCCYVKLHLKGDFHNIFFLYSPKEKYPFEKDYLKAYTFKLCIVQLERAVVKMLRNESSWRYLEIIYSFYTNSMWCQRWRRIDREIKGELFTPEEAQSSDINARSLGSLAFSLMCVLLIYTIL